MVCRELAPLPIPMFHAIHSPLTDSQILKSLLLGGVLLLPAIPSPLNLSLPHVLLPGTSVWQSHVSVLCVSQGTASGPVCSGRGLLQRLSLRKLSMASGIFLFTPSTWGLGKVGVVAMQRALSGAPGVSTTTWPAASRRGSVTPAPSTSPEQRTQAAAGHCSLPPGPVAWPSLPIPQSQFRVGAHGAFNNCLWTWLSCQHILGLQSWVMSPGAC